MEMYKFNELPIGTVFCHPQCEDWKFVKFANANPCKPPHAQAPNCFALHNNHYFSLHAGSRVMVIKEPADYDDSTLVIE